MVDSTPPKQLIRFDFPPGATPKQIAEALKKAHAEIMARKEKRMSIDDD